MSCPCLVCVNVSITLNSMGLVGTMHVLPLPCLCSILLSLNQPWRLILGVLCLQKLYERSEYNLAFPIAQLTHLSHANSVMLTSENFQKLLVANRKAISIEVHLHHRKNNKISANMPFCMWIPCDAKKSLGNMMANCYLAHSLTLASESICNQLITPFYCQGYAVGQKFPWGEGFGPLNMALHFLQAMVQLEQPTFTSNMSHAQSRLKQLMCGPALTRPAFTL